MKISRVEGSGTGGSFQHPALREISAERLRRTVESLAYPRHFIANRRANREARDWIYEELRSLGYSPTLQGEFDNVIATGAADHRGSNILLGAHYDTVPTTPGADDNNSAIAVCLEAARVLAQHELPKPQLPPSERHSGYAGL